MPFYAQVKNGKIRQIAEGYSTPPFKDVVEITEEIAQNPKEWIYDEKNNKFVYTPAALTVKDINKEVVKKIRAKYDINEEYEMLRRGILDKTDPEFKAYNAYVEGCRTWGKAEKEKKVKKVK